MTAPHDSIAAPGRPGQSGAGASRYLFLLAVQTSGAVILFWYSVPLYRQALLDLGSHLPRTENLVWSLAITLMQSGFWIRHRLRPPLPRLRDALLGYFVLFIARMSFVLATSIFGFVFIVRRSELYVPTSRYFVLVIGLFALFCYIQEPEQLGRELIGPDPGKER